MKKRRGIQFEDLMKFLQIHIQKAVEDIVEEKMLNVKKLNEVSVEKIWYNLKEVEKITGLSRIALKKRRDRGKLELVNDANTLLMHKDELERLKTNLDKQRKRA